MAKYYYSGQGSLLMATRFDNGTPGAFLRIGNVPELTLNIETEKSEHKESESGSRLVDYTLSTEKTGTFEFTLESLSLENLALGLWGSSAEVQGGSVTSSGADLEIITFDHVPSADEIFAFAHPLVSSVSLFEDTEDTPDEFTDSDSLNSDPHSIVVDELNGTFSVNSPSLLATHLTGATGQDPIKVRAAYTYAKYMRMDAFTRADAPERWLRFQGINTVDNSRVLVDLFRAQFDPLTDYGLINEELGSVTMGGTILADSLRTSGSQFFSQRNYSKAT